MRGSVADAATIAEELPARITSGSVEIEFVLRQNLMVTLTQPVTWLSVLRH